MENSSLNRCHDFYRYLDFAESQHLQALTNLCQNTDDMHLYALLVAHKEEVGKLIARRRELLQGLDGRAAARESNCNVRGPARARETASV